MSTLKRSILRVGRFFCLCACEILFFAVGFRLGARIASRKGELRALTTKNLLYINISVSQNDIFLTFLQKKHSIVF